MHYCSGVPVFPLTKMIMMYSDHIIISAIVVAELFAEAKGDAELSALEEFVSIFRVAPVNVEIAKAGELYNSKFGKSHGVGLADAILAATRGRECRA